MDGKKSIGAALCFFNRRWVVGILVAYGAMWLAFLLFQSCAIGWDGHYVVMGGVVLNTSGIEGERAVSLCSVLGEGFSHWFLVGIAVVYAVVLMSLSNSFTVNGSLWLRLLVEDQKCIVLGRIILAVGFLFLLATTGIVWTFTMHWRHRLDLSVLSSTPIALIGYCALSSGSQIFILTWLDPRKVSSQTRNCIQLIVLLIPFITWLIWVKIVPPGGDVPATRWVPFSLPYISTELWTLPHSYACLILGCIFYAASLLHIIVLSRSANRQQSASI